MSGPLALVGGIPWTQGCTFDRDLLDVSGATHVVVVPTGAAYEDPQGLVARAVEWFEALGVEVIEVPAFTRRDAYDADLVATVRGSRFTYLPGSSPMHLRSVLKDTPLFDALVDAWRAGGVLAGAGAGADVLCDPMVDTRGGAFTVGLGVVAGIAAIPLAETWSPEKVHRTVELAPKGVPVVSIPESTALICDPASGWASIGAGTCTVYLDGALAGLEVLPSLGGP